MRQLLKYILIAAAVTLQSCTFYTLEHFSENNTEISLTWRGDTRVNYTPGMYQLSYNDNKNTYRVVKDDISEWFVVECSEKPTSNGQKITATVSWKNKTEEKSLKNISLEVIKSDDFGKIWLWGEGNKLGIVIINQ